MTSDEISLACALIVIACKIVTAAVPPPAATSRWAILYNAVSLVALNIGWAVNRIQPGKTAVMTTREDASALKAAAVASGIPLVSPRPTDKPT